LSQKEARGYAADHTILLRTPDRVRLEEVANINYNFCMQHKGEMAACTDINEEMKKTCNKKHNNDFKLKATVMRQILVLTIMLLLGKISMQAQKFSIENVYKVTLRSFDAIKEGSEVKGYYFFYISDKIDKKTNGYTLQITDNNLNKLTDIKFQDSKNVIILESSFNGTDLAFMFYDLDSKMLEYQVYGADGKKKYTYNRELTKKDMGYIAFYLKSQEENEDYSQLQPIEGKGFISNMPSREGDDYTFQIDFFSTEKKRQWSYIPSGASQSFSGTYLGCFKNVVYLSLAKASWIIGSINFSIIGLSLETGKVLFEITTFRLKNKVLPFNMSEINGKAFIYGQYLAPNGNLLTDNSIGFAFLEMNDKGTIVSEKYCSWSADLSKYLDVNSKGKIDDFGYMFVHNMIATANGEIYAIGEGYRTAGAKAKVTDMMFIKFDKDLNVKGATIYDKNANTAAVQGPHTPLILGASLKSSGSFDYTYSQANKDRTSFSVCYSDYVKGKSYKGITFNSITYNEGKITIDKINTKSDASKSYILPGKQGQVLILDYYKKDKRLDAHFEKLN